VVGWWKAFTDEGYGRLRRLQVVVPFISATQRGSQRWNVTLAHATRPAEARPKSTG
jgi:hypothetical protein